jgi:hypothetical protein
MSAWFNAFDLYGTILRIQLICFSGYTLLTTIVEFLIDVKNEKKTTKNLQEGIVHRTSI